MQQGSCNTKGITVKLLPGCIVYKKPLIGSEGLQGASLVSLVSEGQQRLRLQRCQQQTGCKSLHVLEFAMSFLLLIVKSRMFPIKSISGEEIKR